ncbi:hypothetical protein BJ322DRAFT_1024444 [Thelephora terrestris]|uniref:Uncharacterized protein n=1 Tax=Thelephora terrestris TaxID=56493 RepID=A0A9P6L2P0_9AGAM|nr:hypothetical protein BJ322DRAFT_1024444 [Thelephora terrestris]
MPKRASAQGPASVDNRKSKVLKAVDSLTGDSHAVEFTSPHETPTSVPIDVAANSLLDDPASDGDAGRGASENDAHSSGPGNIERAPTTDSARDEGAAGSDLKQGCSAVSRVKAPDQVFSEVLGTNAFSVLFPGTRVLDGASAVSTWMTGDGTLDFTMVPATNVLEMYRPTHASRLLKCASHPDVTSLKSPKGGIINVALREPASLSLNPNSGYLRSKENSSWILASLTGQVTYFSNSGIRQICVTPFAHRWYRFVAVLAAVCEQPILYFQSFKGGVTFGTNRLKRSGYANKKPRQHVAPIDGSSLKDGDAIPVYDGREQLRLGSYWEKPYLGDVKKDSAAMMLFSIRKGALPSAIQEREDLPRALTTAVYFNILGVVVLAEPGEKSTSDNSGEGPEAFGVNSVQTELPELEDDGEVGEGSPCL